MNILIVISRLPFSNRTVLYGGQIARVTNADVTLLAVVSSKQTSDVTERMLEDACALIPDIVVTTKIRKGKRSDAILSEINQGSYDLVVIRARGALGLSERLRRKLGRVIAQKASVSVLIVKKNIPKLRNILVCTGGLEVSEPVIRTCARLAQLANARVVVLYVTTPVPTMYTGLGEIEETLPELLQTDTPIARHLRSAAEIMEEHNVEARLEICQGVVAEEIVDHAQGGEFDLVVVGASGVANNLTGWMLGDVTSEVVNYVQCPIWIVRGTYNEF